WVIPKYSPDIYIVQLPYLQVEEFGVIFSPFNHRGLYLKGYQSNSLHITSTIGNMAGSAGIGIVNFASLPYNVPWECGYEIRDIEGNRYRTVAFDDMCWMADNLATATYKDGTPIRELRQYTPWTNPDDQGNWAHY